MPYPIAITLNTTDTLTLSVLFVNGSSYGDGKAEQVVGEAFAGRIRAQVDQFFERLVILQQLQAPALDQVQPRGFVQRDAVPGIEAYVWRYPTDWAEIVRFLR